MPAGRVVREFGAALDERAENVVAVVLDPAHESVLEVGGFYHVYLGTGLQCVCVRACVSVRACVYERVGVGMCAH